MRVEPPPSLAWAIGTMPAATAAAEPPDEPPGVRVGSHGLRVGAERGAARSSARIPNSGRFVMPTIDEAGVAQPRARGRRSIGGGEVAEERRAEGQPLPGDGRLFLIAIGTPANGRSSPGRSRRRRPAPRSSKTSMNALRLGFSASIRESDASTSSRARELAARARGRRAPSRGGT